MKTRNLLIAIILTGLLASTLNAQAVKEADLPANEKAQLVEARKAALKADPALKQLTIDAKQAKRDAIIKADPSVALILDNVMPVKGPPIVKVGELPAEDLAKFKAAMKASKADPSVSQKEMAAKQAMRDAMIKADPAVAPILDKLSTPAKAE
jgi:hypothetical protein